MNDKEFIIEVIPDFSIGDTTEDLCEDIAEEIEEHICIGRRGSIQVISTDEQDNRTVRYYDLIERLEAVKEEINFKAPSGNEIGMIDEIISDLQGERS